MLKKVLLGIAAVFAVLVAVVALQPAAFKIERSTQIHAPASVVFAYLNDFHAWEAWSPWAKLDPNMKTTYSGAPRGEGAIYEWSGNDQVGAGRMQIIEARDPSQLDVQIDFLAPMKAKNLAQFELAPVSDATRVSWVMTGHNGFMGKAFSLVMNMDKLVGNDFEKGLAALKQQAESKAQASAR